MTFGKTLKPAQEHKETIKDVLATVDDTQELGGLRYDAGKPRVDLIPPDAMLALGVVFEVGAQKYAERNWEKGMKWGKMIACLLRHTFAFMMGEDRDPESGLLHTQHIAWNAIALLTYQLRNIGEDNRHVVVPKSTV